MREGWQENPVSPGGVVRIEQIGGFWAVQEERVDDCVRWRVVAADHGPRLVSDAYPTLEEAMDAAEWLSRPVDEASRGLTRPSVNTAGRAPGRPPHDLAQDSWPF